MDAFPESRDEVMTGSFTDDFERNIGSQEKIQ
jgi:hypothetical protein